MTFSLFPQPSLTREQEKNGARPPFVAIVAIAVGFAFLLSIYVYLIVDRKYSEALISEFPAVSKQYLLFPYVTLMLTFIVGILLPPRTRKTFSLAHFPKGITRTLAPLPRTVT